jgi:hypothetical protein
MCIRLKEEDPKANVVGWEFYLITSIEFCFILYNKRTLFHIIRA